MSRSIPFCPNPECPCHYQPPEDGEPWYKPWGHYHSSTFGKTLRFKCICCGRTFSIQTFSLDYYVKKRVSYREIEKLLHCSASTCETARALGVREEVIANRTARLARQAVAVQETLSAEIRLQEELSADGFESFCRSQYFPCHLNLVVGTSSQYVYDTDYCTLRRKGRMTEEQKRVRSRLERRWKADPQALELSFQRLGRKTAERFERSGKQRLVFYTDEHPGYVRGLERVPELSIWKAEGRFLHKRTSSKDPRTVHNPLFAVNYMDRELRKDMANFVRESTRFARNVDDLMNRVAVYVVYHNFRKPYRVKRNRKERRVHGERAGLKRERIEEVLEGYYTQRKFFTHQVLSKVSMRTWFRMWENPMFWGNKYIPRYIAA